MGYLPSLADLKQVVGEAAEEPDGTGWHHLSSGEHLRDDNWQVLWSEIRGQDGVVKGRRHVAG